MIPAVGKLTEYRCYVRWKIGYGDLDVDVDLDVAMERGFETSIKFKAKKQTMEMSDYEAMLTKEVAQRGGITRDRPRSFLTQIFIKIIIIHIIDVEFKETNTKIKKTREVKSNNSTTITDYMKTMKKNIKTIMKTVTFMMKSKM